MKKLLVLLCLLPSFAFAKEVFRLNVEIMCIDADGFVEFMEEYEEEALLTMVSVRKTYQPPYFEAYSTVLFVNKENKSWTLVEQRDDFYCITSMGEEIKPYISGKKS